MNLVEITVRSNTTEASRAIVELKAKLDEFATKVAEARVKLAGDDKAQEQITRINARLIELSRRVSDPKISLEGVAKAQAEILLLMSTLDKLGDKKPAKLSVGSGLHGILGAIQSGLNSILSMGPSAIPVLAGVAAAVLAITTQLSALVTELGAAGIGVGAFAAFAVPTFMKIGSGIQAVSAAAGKVRLDGMVNGITAAQKAADKLALSKAWTAIPAALRPAVQAGLDLKGTFDKMVTAMQPQVVRIFSEALKAVGNILPQLLPLAHSVGSAIIGLLKQFDGFTKSAGFKSFLSQMDALSGPSVRAIGQGIGQIAGSLGDLLQAGASPAGLAMLKGTFTVIAVSIRGIANAARIAQAGVMDLVKAGIWVGRALLNMAQMTTDGFLAMASTLVGIAAKIPGPWQNAAKSLEKSIGNARATADNFFAGATAKMNQFTSTMNNANPIYKMHGDIRDLQNKVAASKALIRSVPPSKRVAIEANIARAEQQIAAIRVALAALNGTTATTYVQTIPIGGGTYLRHEAGGITGAAAGGIRGNLTMVGEHGRELVSLPPGSMVHSNPDTEGIMSQGGTGTQRLIVSMDPQMPHGLARELLKWIRFTVRTAGGGDVQVAFGES